jgi:hypothetical protein
MREFCRQRTRHISLCEALDRVLNTGVDWWVNHPAFSRHQQEHLSDSFLKIEERLARIETRMPAAGGSR